MNAYDMYVSFKREKKQQNQEIMENSSKCQVDEKKTKR